MKIAWVTPLATASAIGRVTVQVAEHMQGEAEVHLWCADRGECHPTSVPVFETLPAVNHYTILHGLATADGRLHELAARLLGLRPGAGATVP